ncbi:PTS glucose transporter subunit IIA [Paenibacillus elgii]|uniref:PTS sugar transporter subunit IIA n=1 Tax=Paenibacillus elgii TaxID=189691 RepID=UPI002D7DF283|nr:PTS glucose transporter subunit IIA [Paenibacillus elgii]
MFKKSFFSTKRKTEEILISPMTGRVLAMEDVPDPVFSNKKAGLGIAVDPEAGTVVSPVDGVLVHLFRTKHALWIRGESGLDILIHIGLDTVYMQGEGFKALAGSGERVKTGQPLSEFSLDLVRKKAASAITPMFLITPSQIEHAEIELPDRAEMGVTPLMKVKVKPYAGDSVERRDTP